MLAFKNTTALLYIIHTNHPFNVYKSMVFSIFTYTCDTNSQFYTTFVTSRVTLYPFSYTPQSLPSSPPTPRNSPKQTQTYFLYRFAIFLDISHKWNQHMVFCIWLPSLSVMFTRFFSGLLCTTSSSYCQIIFHLR